MNPQGYTAINFPADVGGCGHYRMIFPRMALQTIARDIRFVESFKLITDPNFFRDVRTIRLQRQVNNVQADYFMKFLKPIADNMGLTLIYEIDDVISYDDIPPYNHARDAFQNERFFQNIQQMLNASDFVTVTTPALRDYYVKKYGADINKFVVLPNYLPRWWIGETYNWDRQLRQYKEYNKKPRIGFPSSSSHFDLKGKNNYVDDFTHIVDFIKNTTDKYQWVFIGGCPKQLEQQAKNREIEVRRGSDLLNYPRELWRHNLQCVVAPLQDNPFNYCKSNIKLIESWALGLPCIVQDYKPYSKFTDMTFKNCDELQNQLDGLFSSQRKYVDVIKKNRNIVDYGDEHSPNGWWLEKNLQTWYELYAMPQKTLNFDLTKIKEKQQEQKQDSGIELEL